LLYSLWPFQIYGLGVGIILEEESLVIRTIRHILYAEKPVSGVHALKFLVHARGGKITEKDIVALVPAAIKDDDPAVIKELVYVVDKIPMASLEQAMSFLESKGLIERPKPPEGKEFKPIEKMHLYIGEIKKMRLSRKEEARF
jgi:predicted transcriptional regulator